jgi:D-apiose dehydrogenase
VANNLRFAILGTGFWSYFQLAAWYELPGVECVALYNRTRSKAEALAQKFGVARVYDDVETLLSSETLDFVDIISDVFTHEKFVEMAAGHRFPVICQKPMAPSYEAAERMVAGCKDAGVPFFIHENFRWQTPMRQLKHLLDENHIGRPFRARIDMVSGFPVFVNQPFLGELDQFVLTDVGSHVLDLARFFFGEASSLYCHTQRIHSNIKGEDVATVLLRMKNGASVECHMGYAENYLERDRFPQTFIFIEGECGSLELGPDYDIRITTDKGTLSRRYPPPRYQWADPAYDVVHASIVPCNADLLAALRGEKTAETTGEDNLKTMQLVFTAYESAAQDAVIKLS